MGGFRLSTRTERIPVLIWHGMLGAMSIQQAVVNCLSYLAAPVLVSFAFRGWKAQSQKLLTKWRGRLGRASILLTSFVWCSVILVIAADRNRVDWARSIAGSAPDYLSPLALLPVLLAVALRGWARVCAISAGLSMCVFLATSWVT